MSREKNVAADDATVSNSRKLRLTAIVAGLVGAVLCLVSPLLPVKESAASLAWPQLAVNADLGENVTADVIAPLVTQSSTQLTASIPCSAISQIADGNVLSTIPKDSEHYRGLGLAVSATATDVTVSSRNTMLVATPRERLTECSVLNIWSNVGQVGAEFVGTGLRGTTSSTDRPVVAGVFTDLSARQVAETPGIALNATVDTRFDTSASPIKLATMLLGVLLVLGSLGSAWALDRRSPRRTTKGDDAGAAGRTVAGGSLGRGLLGRGAFRGALLLDLAVLLCFALWNVLGAGGPDDGYMLTMGRNAGDAGYLANYYRFFGAPEAPFDWYYTLLGHWSSISTAGVWMRIPALAAGFLSWLLLSRSLIPRMLERAKGPEFPLAYVAAAAMLLAYWLPMDSTLRMEPIIILGTLTTWALVERALAHERILPAALATLTAALTLALGPHGIVALAVLIVSARPMLELVAARRRRDGLLALIVPILAAPFLVIVVAFRDQSAAAVAEAIRIRYEVGPIHQWYAEPLNYYALTVNNPDGSLAIRTPILLSLSALLVLLFIMLRKTQIPHVVTAPVWRLIGAMFIAGALLWLTPIKWTLHYSVFAGFAAAVAAVVTVGVTTASRTSIRNFTLFTAGLMFTMAAALSGDNAWPWPFSWGIPWFDRAPLVAGVSFSNIFLILAAVFGAIAAWQHYRTDFTGGTGLMDVAHVDAETEVDGAGATADERKARRFLLVASTPMAAVAGFLVVCEVLVFAWAAVRQNPAYSVTRGNIDALSGDSCALANAVLVESDPNAAFLASAEGHDATRALEGENPVRFDAAGVPTSNIEGDYLNSAPGRIDVATSQFHPFIVNDSTRGTGGGSGDETINGSNAALPYGLDPTTTPVLGSWGHNDGPAMLRTDWYTLPAANPDQPLVVFSAAGSIRSVDPQGQDVYGQAVRLEWAVRGADGTIGARAEITPLDPDPNLPWRNLRVPRAEIPAEANVVRIVVDDPNIGSEQWVAVTGPRVPTLHTLTDTIGEAPALVDPLVGQQVPCINPVTMSNGVWNLPQWRVLPTRKEAIASSKTWQATEAGGPLFLEDTVLKTTTVPTYLRDDWQRNWGDVQRYETRQSERGGEWITPPPARLTVTEVTRNGWWRDGPIRALTDQTER